MNEPTGGDLTWSAWLGRACRDVRRAADLLPPGRGQSTWSPTAVDAEVAWITFTELSTRVTTQALPLKDGDESTALKSLVDFFRIARGAISAHPRSFHASALIVHGLNTHLRPFTAHWHAQAAAGDLRSMDQRFRFRAELARLQEYLRALAAVMGAMAGDEGAATLLDPLPPNAAAVSPSDHLKFGIPVQGPRSIQIAAVNEAEAAEIAARRGIHPTGIDDAVGLAISGGGIRSATFALGIVQTLAWRGLLRDVDVMSTVSGGGYIGSFISTAVGSTDPNVGLANGQMPFGAQGQAESTDVRHIRNHSKYLIEGGWLTVASVVFAALFGVMMVLIFIAPVALLLGAIAIDFFGTGKGTTGWIPASLVQGSTWVVWGLLASCTIAMAVMRKRAVRTLLEQVSIVLFVLAVAALAMDGLGLLVTFAGAHPERTACELAVLPVLLGAIGMLTGSASRVGNRMLGLLVLTGPLLFLCVWLVGVDLALKMNEVSIFLPWGVAAALLVLTCFAININFSSPHLYYRDRLVRTYLARQARDQVNSQLRLSAMNAENKAPLHLINATVNLPGSRDDELRGRTADFFTFGRSFCGGPLTGWSPTAAWEANDPHLDLGTAMAISAAAAAPRMGRVTSARYSAILAMLNVRLGYWLRRPGKSRWFGRVPGAPYFLRELLGWMDERAAFINLSDGGHLENIGLYELLRRRCRYIVVIDGEEDPEHRFDGLLNAVQMAHIDLGVSISPDLADLRRGQDRFKRAHFIMAHIDYGGKVKGLLLVLKLAMTGNEPEVLKTFQDANPSFPHQSTGKQVFSEAQFEAYRALGQHAAEAALDPLLAGETPGSVGRWMHELEARLLPIR